MAPYANFSLWLTPSDSMRALLRATIRQLAAQLDAVDFEPHVTVFSGLSTDSEARDVARRIAGQFAPIELTADRLDHSELFTKSLFVQFEQSAILKRMFETAATSFSRPSSYRLNPHLSLLYKRLSEASRVKLCETLDVPKGSYRFDRVRMIETELPIEDDGPIRRWRTISDDPLLEPEAHPGPLEGKSRLRTC